MSNYQESQNQSSVRLNPTNIPGAFTSPAPPYGFVAAWRRAFSQDLPRDRIEPRLESQVDNYSNTSISRSGGKLESQNNEVLGYFSVPYAVEFTDHQGSCSVGIKAYGSDDILKAGIQQGVESNGSAPYVPWYLWYHINKVTLDDTSEKSPALASFKDNIYIAWTGAGNNFLNVMYSADNGKTFGNKYVSTETSLEGPTLTVHNSKLYIAWIGVDNNNLNVAHVTMDGSSITGLHKYPTLNDTSPKRPALASFMDKLYIAWSGTGNNSLNMMYSPDDGENFVNKYTSTTETSSEAPTLALNQDNLYIAWKGEYDDKLNNASVNIDRGGTINGFNKALPLADTSPKSPALTSFNNNLYTAWTGNNNDYLNVMYSTDGCQSFGHKYCSTEETSPEGPALAVSNGKLFIAWTGGGNNLNVAVVAENNAQGTTVITGFSNSTVPVNITNFPISPGQTVICYIQYDRVNPSATINFAIEDVSTVSVTLAPPPGAASLGDYTEWMRVASNASSVPKLTRLVSGAVIDFFE